MIRHVPLIVNDGSERPRGNRIGKCELAATYTPRSLPSSLGAHFGAWITKAQRWHMRSPVAHGVRRALGKFQHVGDKRRELYLEDPDRAAASCAQHAGSGSPRRVARPPGLKSSFCTLFPPFRVGQLDYLALHLASLTNTSSSPLRVSVGRVVLYTLLVHLVTRLISSILFLLLVRWMIWC